jgi:hypothetical protein
MRICGGGCPRLPSSSRGQGTNGEPSSHPPPCFVPGIAALNPILLPRLPALPLPYCSGFSVHLMPTLRHRFRRALSTWSFWTRQSSPPRETRFRGPKGTTGALTWRLRAAGNSSLAFPSWPCAPADKAPFVLSPLPCRRLNELAARLIKPGGLLVSCTCSGAMTQSGEFPALVMDAVAAAGKSATLLVQSGAASDHVIHPVRHMSSGFVRRQIRPTQAGGLWCFPCCVTPAAVDAMDPFLS